MEFSIKLQRLKNASHLTQEQLAEKLFVSRVTISK
ncbi:MAG: helix-turn-helix transcriptional regulator [Treponema sp.]